MNMEELHMNYEKPNMEVIVLNEEDVITSSPDNGGSGGTTPAEDWGELL